MKLGSHSNQLRPISENLSHTTCTYFWLTTHARTLQQLSRSFWIIAIRIGAVVITYFRLISLQSRSDGSFWSATCARGSSIDRGRLYYSMSLHNWCMCRLRCLALDCIVVRVAVDHHTAEGLVIGGIIWYISTWFGNDMCFVRWNLLDEALGLQKSSWWVSLSFF